MKDWETIVVPRERVEYGGDIDEAYSADRISEEGKIRQPFTFNGKLWVNTGGCLGPGNEYWKAYVLVEERFYTGTMLTYSLKVGSDGGERARNDPNGFYHGVAVKWKGKTMVLCGPPVLF